MKEIHLWNLETLALVKKYEGQKQGRFVIRSCFGGPDEDFVISGSEDYNVYVWHREKGKIIDRLPGHGGILISNRMC
jgi:WD40 repeat protein